MNNLEHGDRDRHLHMTCAEVLELRSSLAGRQVHHGFEFWGSNFRTMSDDVRQEWALVTLYHLEHVELLVSTRLSIFAPRALTMQIMHEVFARRLSWIRRRSH